MTETVGKNKGRPLPKNGIQMARKKLVVKHNSTSAKRNLTKSVALLSIKATDGILIKNGFLSKNIKQMKIINKNNKLPAEL